MSQIQIVITLNPYTPLQGHYVDQENPVFNIEQAAQIDVDNLTEQCQNGDYTGLEGHLEDGIAKIEYRILSN